jgi:hypothetical protein
LRWILIEAGQHAFVTTQDSASYVCESASVAGHRKDIRAVAKRLPITIYYLLAHHGEYRDLRTLDMGACMNMALMAAELFMKSSLTRDDAIV